jgi:hypothetical protein
MDGSGKIELEWADMQGGGSGRKHVFCLTIRCLEELQDKCDAGPQLIWQRLVDGTWKIADVRETLRLGLIGGEMKPIDAAKMVDRYVDTGSLLANVIYARAVLQAALAGPPVKKKRKQSKPTTTEPTTGDASSTSPESISSAPV